MNKSWAVLVGTVIGALFVSVADAQTRTRPKPQGDPVAHESDIALVRQEIQQVRDRLDKLEEAIRQLQETLRTMRPPTKADPNAPVRSLESATLFAHYAQNEVRADEDYKGKRLLVSGTVKRVGKDITDTPYVSFESKGEVFSVQCMFSDAKQAAKLRDISPGKKLSVSGVCEGKLGNVILSDCRVE